MASRPLPLQENIFVSPEPSEPCYAELQSIQPSAPSSQSVEINDWDARFYDPSTELLVQSTMNMSLDTSTVINTTITAEEESKNGFYTK